MVYQSTQRPELQENEADRVARLRVMTIARDREPTEGIETKHRFWSLPVLVAGVVAGAVAGACATLVTIGYLGPLGGTATTDDGRQSGARAMAPPSASPAQQSRLVASGYVVARRRATVAAEITGRVLSVAVEEGQRVSEGQLLAVLDSRTARIDTETARARVEVARAAVAAANADAAEARRIVERSEELARRGFATNADLTRNRSRLATLDAQVLREKAELSAAFSIARGAITNLAKYDIRAPFDGVVVDKNAQPGEIISPISAGGSFTRSGICTLVDMDSLEIEVDVNEAYISKVRVGQRVEAQLDAYPNDHFGASVAAVVPTASRDKATVKVRIKLDSADERILPDMAVKVLFRS